jgi:hypothetical protein
VRGTTELAEAQEERCRRENARKAKEAADRLFPGEQWQQVEEVIYLSPHRPIGKKTNFAAEKRDAEILRDLGGTVYFVPEGRSTPGKKYDAIVNGEEMEFKNVGGNATTLQTQFLKSRYQAPNVFINLEESSLTKGEVITALHGARNIDRFAQQNKFTGGRIILKIGGLGDLVYLDVDSLKKTAADAADGERGGLFPTQPRYS